MRWTSLEVIAGTGALPDSLKRQRNYAPVISACAVRDCSAALLTQQGESWSTTSAYAA
jgi:hypothetical protein